MFEDITGVIRSRKLKTKDQATRNPQKTRGALQKGKQFLLHMCHSCYKPEDKS